MKKKTGRLNTARKINMELSCKLAAQKKELAARNKRISELEAENTALRAELDVGGDDPANDTSSAVLDDQGCFP